MRAPVAATPHARQGPGRDGVEPDVLAKRLDIGYTQCVGDCGDPGLPGAGSIWVADGSYVKQILARTTTAGVQPAGFLDWGVRRLPLMSESAASRGRRGSRQSTRPDDAVAGRANVAEGARVRPGAEQAEAGDRGVPHALVRTPRAVGHDGSRLGAVVVE
jgi:hypothetical protein